MEGRKCFEHEILREGEEKILRIDCSQCTFPPSVEDSAVCMAKTIELLSAAGGVTKIVLVQNRDYEYDFGQTKALNEIARLYTTLANEKKLSYSTLIVAQGCERYLRGAYASLKHTLSVTLKADPIAAYVQLKRFLREEKIKGEYAVDNKAVECGSYFNSVISWILKQLEKTQIMALARLDVEGYKIGNRDIYRRIFNPIIKPDFMFTKLMATYPLEGEVVDNYSVKNTEVTIFEFGDSVKTLYHIVPPEFKFSEEKYEILDSARKIMSEHEPSRSEFVDPERMREVFYNIGKDLVVDLAQTKEISLSEDEISELAQVLLRYTVGFGLIEVLLSDPKIQDISINSPMGETPMFIVHQDYDDCETNIIPTRAEAESWATKLRLISGRPLDEANPILDTELKIPGMTSRVAAITSPLDPSGIAFSFRRHRDKPWTLPLFIDAKMINPVCAGLLSFLIDGTRTMLVAGTRSSGKTSLLGSILVEIMRRYRIITIEDTLELPTDALRKMGFNIQSLKVAGALAGTESVEVSATRGIRSTLRLGDSALIIGEVRSEEAISLYEAMRVGAAANVVAGTIHAATPYGVYDRVVNDIGVPRTSFKATDIIIVANPIRSVGGLKRQRRVLQVTEVRKDWEEDPLKERGFVDLLKYDPKTDELVVTDELMNGESDILKSVAANVKEFAGNWDAVWENIQLRGDVRKALVDVSYKSKNRELIEAEFVAKSNDAFHDIIERIKTDVGGIESKRVFFEFNEWLKKEVKKS